MVQHIGGSKGGGCFRAGSLVQLNNGITIPIEELKVGDEILSFKEDDSLEISKVTKVHYHPDNQPILRIKYWRGYIDLTPNHWVQNQFGSFVEAVTLGIDDAFIDGMGHLRPIISSEVICEEPTYNLTVEPNHTFICNNIRVHNGGHRETYPIVGSKGSSSSKSSGGGRAPVEAPDSLVSRAYAQIIDLLCEGEIQGLTNGARSIFLDETPLMSANGSYNFSGVNWDFRSGTQDQTYIQGFDNIKNSTNLGVQVKGYTPTAGAIPAQAPVDIVRTYTNPNIDAVDITIGIPALQTQNITTGDVSGTSVTLRGYLQYNGGGYYPANISTESFNISISNNTAIANAQYITAQVTFQPSWYTVNTNTNWYWLFLVYGIDSGYPTTYQYYPLTYNAEYRSAVTGWNWTTISSETFYYNATTSKSESIWVADTIQYNNEGGGHYEILYSESHPSTYRTFQVPIHAEQQIEFRVRITSSYGTVAGMSAQGYRYHNRIEFSGKASSRYQRTQRFYLPQSGTWNIKITRDTYESTTGSLANETWIDGETEIIFSRLNYPNSALAAISIDASQFSAIPVRAYDVKLLKIKVPINYDPETRAYSGSWDGTFKVAWTDNPAWCFYDLCTNSRYGLGNYLESGQIDKWALYTIGKYCDEIIPNGLGGFEPRFTCNMYLQTRQDAYKVINNMVSIFRGMAYWASGSLTVVQDSPADPTYLYNQTNVIDGLFTYSGSSAKVRHTVALVTWNDPTDMCRPKVEYVEDTDGITKYGVIETEVVAIGCISKTQAQRLGKWILLSELIETETISFRTSLEGSVCRPGQVIKVADPARAGSRMGGRIIQVIDSSTIIVDSPLTGFSGSSEFNTFKEDGSIQGSVVLSIIDSTITLVTPLPELPIVGSLWIVSSTDIQVQLFRVISVTETSPTEFQVNALKHEPDKFNAIDRGYDILPADITNKSIYPKIPDSFILKESLYLITDAIVGTKVTLDWSSDGSSFLVKYKVDNNNWEERTTYSPFIEVFPALAGNYTFVITATNSIGYKSSSANFTGTVYGLRSAPNDVTGFSIAAISGNAYLQWDPTTDLDVLVGGNIRIRYTPDIIGYSWSSGVDIGPKLSGTSTNAVLPLLNGTYMAKWIDSTNNESVNISSIIVDGMPNIINMNYIEQVDEHPLFTGTKTDTFKAPGGLLLDSALTIDEELDPIDTWPLISVIGGVSSEGEYYFDDTIDLGSVQISRLTASITALSYDTSDLMDDRLEMDTWNYLDGIIVSDTGCVIYVRTTNDDPLATPTWSDWKQFVVGDWTGRAFQFKARLYSNYSTHNILVSELSVFVDMPDRIDSSEDIISGTTTYSVNYGTHFMIAPSVGITAQNMASGDYYQITNKTNTGFDIIFKNSAGTNISRTFDYIARGY